MHARRPGSETTPWADDAVRNSCFLAGERRRADKRRDDNRTGAWIGLADRYPLDQPQNICRHPRRLRIDRDVGRRTQLAVRCIYGAAGVCRIIMRDLDGHKDREHHAQYDCQQLAEFGFERQSWDEARKLPSI